MSSARGAPGGQGRGMVTGPSSSSRGGGGVNAPPSRRNIKATGSKGTSGRSSTSPAVVNDCVLFSGVPDLSRLTSEQKLEAVQGTMKGEINSVAEASQFFSKKKEKAVKSLSERMGLLEIGQAGSNFEETLEVPIKAKEEQESFDTTFVNKTEEEEEYQPEIGKLVDELIDVREDYKVLMEQAIEAVVEKNFAETLPEEKVVNLLKETDELMQSLEAFKDLSPAENMKLFFPSDSTSSEKKTIKCPKEQQEELMKTVYELSGVVDKLEKFMKSNAWISMESMADKKMQVYKKTVDKMGSDLNDLEKQKSIVEGYAFISTIDDANATDASGSKLNLEFAKD